MQTMNDPIEKFLSESEDCVAMLEMEHADRAARLLSAHIKLTRELVKRLKRVHAHALDAQLVTSDALEWATKLANNRE